MQSTARSRPSRPLFALALLALAAALALPALGLARTATTTKRVVRVEKTASGSLLANLRGHTLYSLSVERHGKFICTGGCLSIWHPLVVPKGVKPTGPVSLGTIERPEGKTQVTYRGRPLYSFAEDTKAGQTNGEGIKDVGTWHAATARAASSPDPEPTVPAQPEPYPAPYPTPPAQTNPMPPQSPPAEQPHEYEYPPYTY
jgi:predicted lipoprotein with Yx(FWY)xxD motif